MVKPWIRSKSHHDPGAIPFRQRNGLDRNAVVDDEALDMGDEDNFTMVIPNLSRPAAQPVQRTPPKPVASPSRLPAPSPRAPALVSPKSMSSLDATTLPSARRSPRMRSPDRPSTRGTDAQDEVQVYEDPFVGDEHPAVEQDNDKPVLEELPINEKSNERRASAESASSDVMMGNDSEGRPRGHHKTTSTGSVMHTEANNAEAMKNRQLLSSGIKRVESRTVEAHMFRRMQDMVRSNQDIWGPNDENFGRLLVACLDFLESPIQELNVAQPKAVNLKVQALATIRAMLSLYRRETSKYFSRVLCTVLRTKAQYENTSHIALDLEATADEIVKYGQTADCLDAVLSLVEDNPASNAALSPKSKGSSLSGQGTFRMTTLGLNTLAALIQISTAKNVALTSEQNARLGKLAVGCMTAEDADVRKANMEFCVALHERIVGSGGEQEEKGF